MINISTLETFSTESELIAPAQRIKSERVCRISNIKETSGGIGKLIFDRFYESSTLEFPEFRLYRLLYTTILNSSKTNHYFAENAVLQDQIGPAARAKFDSVIQEVKAAKDPVFLPGEHLIVGRFGQQTWGH